jgi:hypothetical protein
VLIGGDNYGGHWPGLIDQVRYWGRALSAAEVAEEMNR